MKQFCVLIIVTFFLSSNADGQYSRYIVRLKDKGTNPFSIANPSQYLSQRALQRRQRYNIPIDSTDLPVTLRYIDSLRLAGAVVILNSSKWLNQVAIKTTDAVALAKINNFPFVLSTTAVATRSSNEIMPGNKLLDAAGASDQQGTDQNNFINTLDVFDYGRSNGQVKIHHGEFLHNHGFRGEGMQMVMLDAGFYHYQNLPTFDSVRNNNQILGTWDFVANEASVNEDDTHGMQCMSTIAANLPGLFVGTAPKTSFYLFRTEDVSSEFQIEEQNFVAGLERGDSAGVDICSSSLGYNQFQNPATSYTYADMNGNTSITARGSDLAAKKGIMMVVAAGNEGNSSWHYIITPADGDSVMAVGAVDTLSNVASFSSYGPSSDGDVKPNVAAVGFRACVASPGDGSPTFGNGTSFACPNMAGLTTCLMQAYPEFNNMTIIDAMQRSGTRSSNPDNRIGYGIPDMKKAFVILQKKGYTQQSTISSCNSNISLSLKFDQSMNMIIERKTATENSYSNFKTINGTGNYSQKNISVSDDLSGMASGTVMYRVKMDIVSDTTYFLDSIAVSVPSMCSVPENSVAVNPNPVTDQLNIIVNRAIASNIRIVVNNVSGQRIITANYQQAAGARVQSFPVATMASGIYFISVYADNKKVYSGKFVKK